MTTKQFVEKLVYTSNRYPEKVFSEKGNIYTCVNPYSYHLVRKNSELYDKLNGLMVDGMTMCIWVRLLWGKRIPRLSFDMTGMAADLFVYINSVNNNQTVYFIGARKEEIEKTVLTIKKVYPNINIKGFRNGYFKDDEERNVVIKNIIKENPSFVVVGMGSPIQELFAIDLKEAGYKGIVFTCGGFLHQTTERISYYPNWINKYNLRAFYRLFHEKGLFKRLYNVLIEFPFLFTYDSLKSKLSIRRKRSN